MKKEIIKVLANCELCQKNKYDRYTRMPMQITKRPFQRISVDIVGPLPQTPTGNKYLLNNFR